jgi:inosine-uridine nucleoside N-ribohydrolase
VRTIIDTDCGVDDAVAIWWALTSGHLDVIGFSIVWGNVAVSAAGANVGRILAATGRTDLPIALGATGPIGPAPELRPADFIHGTDGLGNTFRPAPPVAPADETAVSLLRRLVDESPGEVDVLTIGPLTNIAAVLAEDPSWAGRVRRLTVMGGAVATQGNALPVGEANIAHDPGAADAVVRAGWSQPPMLVGLDVTHVATFGADELALLAERRNDGARFLAEPVAFYRTFGSTFVAEGECPCHDLVAAMVCAWPDLVDAPLLPLAIQAGPGPAWGATVADRRAPFFARLGSDAEQPAHEDLALWRVALGVDRDRFRAEVGRFFDS